MNQKFNKIPDPKDKMIDTLRKNNDFIVVHYKSALESIETQKDSLRLSLHQMDTINREIRIENDRLRMMMRGAMRIMRYRKEQNQKLRRELNRVR